MLGKLKDLWKWVDFDLARKFIDITQADTLRERIIAIVEFADELAEKTATPHDDFLVDKAQELLANEQVLDFIVNFITGEFGQTVEALFEHSARVK